MRIRTGPAPSQGVESRMSKARVRKVAISALVTGRSGQYRGGLVAQPLVTAAAASASMLAWWVLPEVSVNPAGGAGGRLRARVRKVGHFCSGDWLVGAVLGRVGCAAFGDAYLG